MTDDEFAQEVHRRWKKYNKTAGGYMLPVLVWCDEPNHYSYREGDEVGPFGPDIAIDAAYVITPARPK